MLEVNEKDFLISSEQTNKLSSERINKIKAKLYEKELSKREAEVVVLVVQGLTNREVADKLCVAEKTVKFHLTNVYKKLNISRRSEIIWTMPFMDFLNKEKEDSTQPGTGGTTSYSWSTPRHHAGATSDEAPSIPVGSSPVSGDYNKGNYGGGEGPTTPPSSY